MPQCGHLLLLKTLEGFLGLSTLLPRAWGALCRGISGFPLSLSMQPAPPQGLCTCSPWPIPQGPRGCSSRSLPQMTVSGAPATLFCVLPCPPGLCFRVRSAWITAIVSRASCFLPAPLREGKVHEGGDSCLFTGGSPVPRAEQCRAHSSC